jgi:SpoVK/Ycf46/Vps4 family AAA+-type ATPase
MCLLLLLQVKTEFMQLWDGMESTRGQRIVVMGATNRPSMCGQPARLMMHCPGP